MTITQTTRFSLYRWDSPNDAFTRQQMDDSHANLESRAGIFLKGALASRPAAAASNDRGFYLDTDNTVLYYSDGTTWRTLNSFAAPSSTLTPGDANAGGAAATIARSDHSHAMLAWASTVASIAAGSGTAGAATTYSRGDHTHALADNSVVAGKIATGGVSDAAQLASGVVTTDKILDSNVTRAKLASTERIPIGAIMPYAGTTEPSGWLFCNGQEVADVSDLGVILGTRFNTGGETSGYVRVPNLTSRFPYGAATMGTGIGAQSGASTVTLTSNELPAHTHGAGSLAVASHSDHTHTGNSITVSTTDTSHTHSIDHDHGSFNTNTDGTHDHPAKYSLTTLSGSSVHVLRRWSSSASGEDTNATGSSSHSHAIDVPSFSGTSGSVSASGTHNHTLSGSTGSASGTLSHSVSGSTGSTGSGNSFSIIPPAVTVNYIIKL